MLASAIKLNDDTTYTGMLSYAEYKLWISISTDDINMLEAATVFSDSEKTSKITYSQKVYDGFTDLIAIFKRETSIKICLQGGNINTIADETETEPEEESTEDVNANG